jgi:hypothetical protein
MKNEKHHRKLARIESSSFLALRSSFIASVLSIAACVAVPLLAGQPAERAQADLSGSGRIAGRSI